MAYTWDADTGEYRDDGGRPVLDDEVRGALAVLIAGSLTRLKHWGDELVRGQIDATGFEEAAGVVLRQAHTAAGMLAHGGTAAMDLDTGMLIGSAVWAQLNYLRGLAHDWSTGQLSPAQFQARLSLYPEALHGTYEAVRRQDAITGGMTQERNQYGGARDHCDGCTAATVAGWVPIGTLRPPGARDCLSHCRCVLTYRTVPVPAGVGA